MKKLLSVVVSLVIVYGAFELAHKNGIQSTLKMKCERLTGFKAVESVNVSWFSFVKRFSDGVYPCTAKLTMTKADGTDETVNVQFDAKRARLVDDVKAALNVDAPEGAGDWAINWYPWGDEYTVSNLKRAD